MPLSDEEVGLMPDGERVPVRVVIDDLQSGAMVVTRFQWKDQSTDSWVFRTASLKERWHADNRNLVGVGGPWLGDGPYPQPSDGAVGTCL